MKIKTEKCKWKLTKLCLPLPSSSQPQLHILQKEATFVKAHILGPILRSKQAYKISKLSLPLISMACGISLIFFWLKDYLRYQQAHSNFGHCLPLKSLISWWLLARNGDLALSISIPIVQPYLVYKNCRDAPFCLNNIVFFSKLSGKSEKGDLALSSLISHSIVQPYLVYQKFAQYNL